MQAGMRIIILDLGKHFVSFTIIFLFEISPFCLPILLNFKVYLSTYSISEDFVDYFSLSYNFSVL